MKSRAASIKNRAIEHRARARERDRSREKEREFRLTVSPRQAAFGVA